MAKKSKPVYELQIPKGAMKGTHSFEFVLRKPGSVSVVFVPGRRGGRPHLCAVLYDADGDDIGAYDSSLGTNKAWQYVSDNNWKFVE